MGCVWQWRLGIAAKSVGLPSPVERNPPPQIKSRSSHEESACAHHIFCVFVWQRHNQTHAACRVFLQAHPQTLTPTHSPEQPATRRTVREGLTWRASKLSCFLFSWVRKQQSVRFQKNGHVFNQQSSHSKKRKVVLHQSEFSGLSF